MLILRRGDVWYARVPYKEEPANQKLRPVLVLGYTRIGDRNEDQVVLVVPITSFGDGGSARRGDIEIPDWKSSGLEKPSWVRARRLWGADPQVLDAKVGCVGSLPDAVLSAVLLEVERLFA